MNAEIKEDKVKERRTKSVVILGLEKSNNDKEHLVNIFSHLKLDLNYKFRRIPNKNPTSKNVMPVIVEFSNADCVSKVLKLKHKLKDLLGYESIYINQDLSLVERIAASFRRKENRVKRKQNNNKANDDKNIYTCDSSRY